ncbi:MAG: glycosyltransferase family 39 protein [Bacteroidales bacterium]|nr:glycosyltransferase family 39 protein [Bacteroidales bacterium]
MKKNSKYQLSFFEKKAENLFSKAGKNFWPVTLLFFCISVLLMVFYKPQIFSRPLEHDALFYLIKALEFNNGFWQPIHFQSEGWPLFLAGFLKIFNVENITEGMLWTRYISLVLMAACIFPFALIAKKILGKKNLITALIVFSLCTTFLHNAAFGNTESLFIFLCLFFVLFLIESREKTSKFLFATAIAALAWYVRPNGIFLLIPLIWIGYENFKSKKLNTRQLLTAILVFMIFVGPHIFLRVYYYGNVFDFGVNSKYWVDSPAQIWPENIKPMSLISFISESGFAEFFSRLIYGIITIFRQLIQIFGEFWSIFFLLGGVFFALIKKDKQVNILTITVLVFIVGFVPVWQVYGVPRHLFVLIPFVYLVALRMFVELIGSIKNKNLVMGIFLLWYTAINFPIITIMEFNKAPNKFERPVVRDEWIDWTLENVEGNIIIGHKKRVAIYLKQIENIGFPGELSETVNELNFKIYLPEYYLNMEEAWQQFPEKKIKYLFIEEESVLELPYLQEVYSEKWRSKFKLVKSYNGSADLYFPRMDIFEVRY